MKTLTPALSEVDYKAALKEAEAFFDLIEEPDPDSVEGQRFKALIGLIAAYEARTFGRN